ncbi:MAG: FAD-dependent oxidoreductase [Desulfovibrionaceae bacterium]|jgi:heterodisulfide reductase subunit A|nr:FAD-dependent oxidoreductase [Desulfovibrionaceae bacterium]
MNKSYDALVVGAGIGGIRAALDLAETGRKVVLTDTRPHIGGLLAQLDYQFPNDHCGMCKMLPLTERDSSSQFCMRKGLFHKNIDILLHTDLLELSGEPGTFKAVLSRQSSFVDPEKCIGCGLCAEACPVSVPHEFNAGLTQRTAVHLPVPHAIPNHYVVDLDSCERCWQCHDACPTRAIDFRFSERKDFRILVASPRPDAAERLAGWFKHQNFPFLHAKTGQEALDTLAKDETIRLLVIDVRIDDPDAERLLERAQEIRPTLPVVASCPPEREHEARALVDLGARDYVVGPLNPATLVPWLDKLYMRLVSEERIEVDVAAVVLAAGFDCYDPGDPLHGAGQTLGYGRLPGVVTSLEFERMCSSTGPSGGRLARHDGQELKRIAWLQCVGSRDLQKKADYCSSVCCMISLKEANLARKRTFGRKGGPAECTVFYMDMRVFGKEYQSYRDTAESNGVRFVPARLHTVLPDPDDPAALRVQYVDDAGRITTETFDMLVLAVGARPPKAMQRLARAAGIETNEWGFCATDYFEPARTSRVGVFAGGAFGQPRDIAESVIQSGAAACNASRLVNLFAPIKDRGPEPEPRYRDVSREQPRILAALCSSCPTLDRALDVDDLARRLEGVESVVRVMRVDNACTGEGWKAVAEAAAELEPNRILIGACMPYAYVPRLRELGAAIGLNPALMDVVDVHSLVMGAMSTKHPTDAAVRERAEEDVFTRVHMSLMRLMGADPSPLPEPQEVTRAALVVGGGLAGMTAAMAIADHGYPVTLVEEAEHLGGTAMKLRRTLSGQDPVRFMEDLVGQVTRHPNITVHTDARVALSMGRAGRFFSVVSLDEGSAPVEHGVTVLATGGHESRIYDYGFRVHKSVLTQLELEQRLASGEIDASALSGVAMMQCWRSRDEHRNYCSRVCCAGMLKNLLLLKERAPDLPVYVFYRDIMSYGFSEQYYTKAREAGAIFVRYSPENRPQVEFEDGRPVITAYDPVLAAPIRVHADLLALSTGIEPNENWELAEIFGVHLDANGFFQEADYKWRPVDFLKQGVFVCGLARAPGSMGETVASAKAAAQRAVRVLSEKRLVCGSVVAEVRDSLCSRCGRCIDVCPYGARSLDLDRDRIVVDELLCQGCGSCAAACPNGASVLRGFTDVQVMSVIDAALGNLPTPRTAPAPAAATPESDPEPATAAPDAADTGPTEDPA